MKKQRTIHHLNVDCSGSLSDSIEASINGCNEQLNHIPKKALFLDDFRNPLDVLEYSEYTEHIADYVNLDWEVVKSYKEFVRHIKINGLPDVVSFDHDLDEEHYSPLMHDSASYNALYKFFKEKTGYHAAKWLKRYIKRNNLPLPIIYCHSRNPVGKNNILGVFNYLK
jgi:hypothetical protein